jgi:tRNA pseudouridine65 synthase
MFFPYRIQPSMHADVHGLTVSILYQDEALVVVDKPAGMLVHRSPGARDPVVVMTFVRDLAGAHAWPVHRLDRATSGIVVVATTLRAAQRMYASFKARAVQKTYLAIVRGTVEAGGRIETPLARHDGTLQDALTEYDVLGSTQGCSLLRVRPQSGRRHQIRRHLHGIGMPVAGDPLYDEDASARPGLGRMALHASRLVFPHPLSGACMEVEAPVPADLRDAVALF